MSAPKQPPEPNLPSKKRIVVKIGSSLLANPDLLTPRWAFMQRLLEDITKLRNDGYEVVLCSSGAVALGLNMLNEKPETAGLRDKQAAAACGMPLLLNAYKQVAHEFGFDIAQVLVTLQDMEERKRFLNTKNTVHRLLQGDILPIVNENDSITTEEIRVGDNDRLAAKVAQMIQADHLVILTCIDGLYDKNPEEPGAQLVEEVHDVSEYIAVTEGTSSLGSGGMLTKMQAERRHMALVIDEYGGVDGLVTIEDLIEQVIGEIEDEHDIDEDKTWIKEKPGQYVALAKTPLEEFEAEIGRSLTEHDEVDEEEIDTLGGLVFMLSGRVPTRGEVVAHPDGPEFEVVDADPRGLPVFVGNAAGRRCARHGGLLRRAHRAAKGIRHPGPALARWVGSQA